MKAHGDFLQQLLADRKVIAHGPVADPAGGWGMSLIEADDTQGADDVTRIVADDPLVKAGIGARYDVLPMLQLHMRG